MLRWPKAACLLEQESLFWIPAVALELQRRWQLMVQKLHLCQKELRLRFDTFLLPISISLEPYAG
jgi:hypothetical protein